MTEGTVSHVVVVAEVAVPSGVSALSPATTPVDGADVPTMAAQYEMLVKFCFS